MAAILELESFPLAVLLCIHRCSSMRAHDGEEVNVGDEE